MSPERIRKDIPMLSTKSPPVYFDNACMTLRPVQVLDKVREYYEQYPACAGRSNHRLAQRVTEEVHKARVELSKFINSSKPEEIVFTRNTTEAINLVANSLDWKEGDVVLTSDKEHNSNLIPWLALKRRGIGHKTYSFGDVEDFAQKVKGCRLASVVQTSNADGSSQDISSLTRIAHDNGCIMMVDAAQSVPHRHVDVRRLGVDFLACSGHKMLGPSGTGLLYGRFSHLGKLNQFIVGGETVKDSTYDSFIPEDIPQRFEAGLQDYAGIIGFAEAARYLKRIGLDQVQEHEHSLNRRLSSHMTEMGATILGPDDADERSGIVSFNLGNLDVHEIALMLDSHRIMVRSGMHCVHSWFNANNLKGSARASMYLYNTKEEVDRMAEVVGMIAKLL
jgi:cysteine desulfurase / selenocysteine lyase